MLNINLLKSEVYKKEKKRLYLRTLLFNFAAIIIISISLSSVAHNQKEDELSRENFTLQASNDSLVHMLTTELISMKERENRIIRSALNLSEDTSYVDFDPYSNNILETAEYQARSLDLIDDIIADKWDSINSVPVG